MNKLKKRKYLIKKLFKVVAKETVGAENSKKVKLLILTKYRHNGSFCRPNYNGIIIGLNLKGLEVRIKEGYSPSYYADRPDRLNKYIINNRHNTLRFILYHEARHAWQKLNNDKFTPTKFDQEFDADSWALAHIKTRPQDRKTKKTDQIKTGAVQTFIPKAIEYIRLYNLGYTTTKIALLCKVKDPRSVRYYLTKAGINLRKRNE